MACSSAYYPFSPAKVASRPKHTCVCAALQGGPSSSQRHPVEASLKHQHRAQQQAAQQPDMRNTAPACSTSSSTYRPGRQLPKHQQRRKARSAPLPIQAVTATLNHATNLSTVQELVHSYGNRLDHVHISTIMRKLVSFKQSDEVLWYTPAAVAAEQLQLLQFEQRRRVQAMRRSRALMSVDGTQWQGPSLSHVSDAADEYTGQEEADDEGPEDSTAADSSGFSRRYSSYAAREADAVSERLASAQGASTSAPGASAARSMGRNSASSRLAAPSSASVGGTPPQTMAQARREAAQQLWALLKRVVQLSCDRRLQFSLHTAATTLEALVRLGYTDQSRVHTLLAATKPLVHELRHQPATAPAVQPPAGADAGSGGKESMVSLGAVLDSTAKLGTASAPGSLQLDSSEGQPALVLEAIAQSHPDVHQSCDLDVEAGSSLPSSRPLPGPGGSSSEEQQAAYPGGMSKSQWRRQRQRQEDAAADAALNTRSVVSLVWACAELQLSPPSGWLDDVEAATLARLPSMSLEEVVALVEALGKLRHRVGDAWLMQCEAATAALLPSAQPREAVRLLAGLWRMRHRPDDTWMQTFLMATGPELESLSTQQLTDLLMVLSRMSCKPSDGWMTAYCGAMEQQLLQGQQQQRRPLSSLASLDGGSGGTLAAVAAAAAGGPGGNGGGGSALTAEQLTSLVTALARLGCRPDSAWLNDCLLRSRRCLPAADASQLSRLIHSLAALRFRASEAWLQLYLSAAFSRMPYASPLECCRMVVALAKLGQKPHGLWLQELTARVRGRLSLFTCGQLAEFAGSLVRLGFRPDSAWLLEFERCSSSKLEQGGCEELVGIVWALAEMGHRPEVSWLYSYVLAAYQLLDSFTSSQLATIFEALPAITPYPGWLDELVQICANERAPAMRNRLASKDDKVATAGVTAAAAAQNGTQQCSQVPWQEQQQAVMQQARLVQAQARQQQQQQQQQQQVCKMEPLQVTAAQQQQQQQQARWDQERVRPPVPLDQPCEQLWSQQPVIITGRGDANSAVWVTAKTSSCLAA